MLLAYLLIITEKLTNVNKAAVAIFAGTVGWVLYICYGSDFVMREHQGDYVDFLNGAVATSTAVKNYIAQNVFLGYVAKAAEVVLFLISTMAIVQILHTNGCFDFLTPWIRTRKSRKMLWVLSGITFILSANLDNLTTTILMLTIMHNLVSQRRQRMIYGSTVLLSANMGGALTVIGDPAGIVLWNQNAVTATGYSMSLFLPCLVACVIPIYLLGRMLPERIEIEWIPMPYRGDDTNLNTWQRLLMLFVGIGGLWFIPTFHSITKLSPFLGALCVLSVLWIVNEVFNHKLIKSGIENYRKIPTQLQYSIIQMILFVMGIMLAVGVVQETGAIRWLSKVCDTYIHNIWLMGVLAAALSTVLDTFTTALSFFSLYPVNSDAETVGYAADFALNGYYWKVIAYATAVGGNILAIGSMNGLVLMYMERIHVGWFFRNVGVKAMIGGGIGLLIMIVTALV